MMDSGKTEENGSDLRVPLRREELSLSTHAESAGDIRIRKRVVTEPRTLTARVAVETVHIDRIAGADRPGAFDDDPNAFKEETIVVPLRREEVQLHKRVVVREELRVAKRTTLEEREVAAEARREELDVDQPSRH